MMNRREFLKNSALAGAAGLVAINTLGEATAWAADASRSGLIVAQGGEPAQLLAAAIAAYGGLGKVVKPGKDVLIKANFSWYGPPEQACCTNPDLLAALVKACLKAGARKVRVVDLAIENYRMCLEASGIEKAVRKAGGEIQDLHLDQTKSPRLVQRTYGVLKGISLYAEALEADCLINVPILKHHNVTSMTGALKNLMGLTPDRPLMHSVGIDQAIVDLAKLIRPHLHIIDAYRVLNSHGPQGRGGTVAKLKQLILTHDPVAGDSYGGTLINEFLSNFTVNLAAKSGLGTADLSKVKITRVKAGA